MSSTKLTFEKIFRDTTVDWGKKYAPNTRLLDIWLKDREYLLWACNLKKGKPCDNPPGAVVRALVQIAHELASGKEDYASQQFSSFEQWFKVSQLGEGLEELPRPSRDECLSIIARCSLLGGHSDLDGLYSMAIAIAKGGALKSVSKNSIPHSRLRIFRYSFKNLEEYSIALDASKNDTTVIIDFSAHPLAHLTLDHHATCLSFWPPHSPLPPGIYDTSIPSCPRLLETYCAFGLDAELLSGCDMIDGARYSSVEQTTDLSNPFVALELALTVDVSDVIAKKVVITLAENNLDPYSVISGNSWKARIAFLQEQLTEQRSYWSKANRFLTEDNFTAVADATLAPYSASRFRYLPFENDAVRDKPFLISLRSSGAERINLGISQNPFFKKKDFFETANVNLGALARSLGRGGGRREVGSCTIMKNQIEDCILKIKSHIHDAAHSTKEPITKEPR